VSNLISSSKSLDIIVTLAKAVKTAERDLGGMKDEMVATLGWLQISESKLSLVHQFQVRDEESIKWYHVSVDVHNGDCHI
jgi:hypothetical protein